MEDIKEPLLAFIKHKHLSQAKFADSIGMQRGNFNKYITAGKSPSKKTIAKIHEIYPDFKNFIKSFVNNYGSVSVVNEDQSSWETIGRLPVYDQNRPANQAPITHFTLPIFSDCQAAVRVKDDSNDGYLSKDDYAIVKFTQNEAIIFGEKYLVEFKDKKKEPVIRFIRKGSANNCWLLKCANPNYDDIEVPIVDVNQVFAVKGRVLNR